MEVRVSAAGHPTAVRLRRWLGVREVQDIWRIDDEWWREHAIERVYYEVRLEIGSVVVIFRDNLGGQWWLQKK